MYAYYCSAHNEVKTPTIIVARVNEENACGVKITCQNVVAAQQWITKTSIEVRTLIFLGFFPSGRCRKQICLTT